MVFLVETLQQLHRMARRHRQNQDRRAGVEHVHGYTRQAHDADAPQGCQYRCEQRQEHALEGAKCFKQNQSNQQDSKGEKYRDALGECFNARQKAGQSPDVDLHTIVFYFRDDIINYLHHALKTVWTFLKVDNDGGGFKIFRHDGINVSGIA